jgi:hypothetical protein
MGIKILNLINMMRELVDIMERKQVLQQFKQEAALDIDCSNEDVAVHLLGQWMRVEWMKNKLMMMTLKKRPQQLNIVFGEIAQSFEKSIFANDPSVNVKNSFLNSKHVRLVSPKHLNEDSIPERLCEDFDTMIIDIYVIPIPTSILAVIRTEMRNSGLTERILNFQQGMLEDLIAVINPSHVRFVCRYKSISRDCSALVNAITPNNRRYTFTFVQEDALSGYRGMMHQQKWIDFILNTTSINNNLN